MSLACPDCGEPLICPNCGPVELSVAAPGGGRNWRRLALWAALAVLMIGTCMFVYLMR